MTLKSMQIDLKKDFLPHFLGLASFYILVIFYFSPIVLDGKMMFQGDILQWEGSAKEIIDYRQSSGEQALWTNRMFGGMPSYLISLESPGDITNALIKVVTLGLPHPINALFLGMVGMYLLLLSLKIRTEISVLGAWVFAFNTFNLISLDAGHNAKIWAVCLIPLIFAGIHLAFSGKKILGLAITAFALMLQLKFNHLQITYYTLLAVLIYGIGQLMFAIKEKELPAFAKTVGILLLGVLLAVGANAGRLLPVLEYGKYSTRGAGNLEAEEGSAGLDREYAFRWSQGKLESLTLLVPNFYGGGSSDALPQNSATETALRQNGIAQADINGFMAGAPTYWGDQPGTGGPIYGGAIMVLFFVIGVIYAPARFRNIFLAITVLSLMLSWGKNLQWFNYTLFDYLPGYNKFRAVSMALGITLFAIPVLGCLGLEKLIQNAASKEAQKSLFVAFGIVGGLALILYVFAGMFGFKSLADANFPDWLATALQEDRKSLLQSDALRSFALITLSAVLVFLMIRQTINYQLAFAGIAILVISDVWLVDKRYLDNDSFVKSPSQSFFAPTPADQKIMKDSTEHFRVLNILESTFNEAKTSYRFNSIGGYHGAKMGRYQELIENALSPEINSFVQKAQEGNFDYANTSVLNMLNTRYIMAGKDENGVFKNDFANGPAWFPNEIVAVSSNGEEMERLAALDTKNQVTLNTDEFGDVPVGKGTIKLIAYHPDKLNYQAQVEQAGLVVFSEIYYPAGWKASINGEEAELLRVDYLLRGLVVPTGNSEIEMTFAPDMYYSSSTLMVITQYIILLLLVAGLIFTYRKN